MATTPTVLISPVYAPVAATALYTEAGTFSVIDKCTVTNVSGNTVTLSLYLVPSGGTAGPSNLIMSSRSIAAGECYTCPEMVGHVVWLGESVWALAGAASALVTRMSGRHKT